MLGNTTTVPVGVIFYLVWNVMLVAECYVVLILMCGIECRALASNNNNGDDIMILIIMELERIKYATMMLRSLSINNADGCELKCC